MPSKQKINLEKVRAALNVVCPKCGYAIPPDRIRRIDSEQIECPECGERFVPGKHLESSQCV
jgi:DNA-directed RNA polymerase subunit RPC12/RpoP